MSGLEGGEEQEKRGVFFLFLENKCDFCGECLEMCPYIQLEGKNEGEEFTKLVRGDKVEWLHQCITCFACNEYCGKGARPFDLILKRMEEEGNYVPFEMVKNVADHFWTDSEPKPVKLKDKVMSVCVMGRMVPWALQGKIFENLTILQGRPYFCHVLYMHLGNESLVRERAENTVKNLVKSGAEEIIFFHEDCYVLLKDLAPQFGIEVPFKVVHFFEYLREFLLKNQNEISPLNMKVAYQRPCASRFTPPEVENYLNEIFQLIGVERVTRKVDGIDALCCGSDAGVQGMEVGGRGERLEPFRENNIQDAKNYGAEALAYFCPMCYRALKDKSVHAGLENYLISDLCRLSLGEDLVGEES